MDYAKIKSTDLVIGQIYTDVPPTSKVIKPMQLQLIKKSELQVGLKNLSNHSNGYKESVDGLIYFSRGGVFFKEIVYSPPGPLPTPSGNLNLKQILTLFGMGSILLGRNALRMAKNGLKWRFKMWLR
jgi:hypothetical protein